MDDLYRENILDHYKNPRRRGEIEDADARGEGMNPLCGDEITITLAYDGDTIRDVRFVGRGCAISQASTSMLMEKIVGRIAARTTTGRSARATSTSTRATPSVRATARRSTSAPARRSRCRPCSLSTRSRSGSRRG